MAMSKDREHPRRSATATWRARKPRITIRYEALDFTRWTRNVATHELPKDMWLRIKLIDFEPDYNTTLRVTLPTNCEFTDKGGPNFEVRTDQAGRVTYRIGVTWTGMSYMPTTTVTEV